MAAEVPLPSTSPRRPVSVPQVRRRAHQAWTPSFVPSSLRGPSFGVRVRSRAHQTPFCARGHQKNIAVSENAPGAHGIVPRHCSTRAAGMNTVSAAAPAAKSLPRNPCRGAAPTAPPPPRSLCRNAKAANSTASATPSTRPPPRDLRRETSAAKPPPRNPRRAAPAEPPLPRREEQQGQTGEQHREIHSLVLDVIFLEEQRSEDESDHDAAAPYHRDDREQRPLILDRIEIECV